MPSKPRPVPTPNPPVREIATYRTDRPGDQTSSFSDLERQQARAVEAEQSSKRKNENPGSVDKSAGKRAGRPRSGRPGSQSNASRGTRGH